MSVALRETGDARKPQKQRNQREKQREESGGSKAENARKKQNTKLQSGTETNLALCGGVIFPRRTDDVLQASAHVCKARDVSFSRPLFPPPRSQAAAPRAPERDARTVCSSLLPFFALCPVRGHGRGHRRGSRASTLRRR